MSKKYLIAEVNVTADGAKVTYLAKRSDSFGTYKTDDIKSVFVQLFDTADQAKRALQYPNECVVSAYVKD